ncbi:MAG: hypothetical protein JJU07_15555 [Natronohydrobacter sp.]|jgi:hypothetical protein|nr:hypothetical protein [Natronohydrobacter sp.]
MNTQPADNSLITNFNLAGVIASYVFLGLSLWINTDVSISTKGFWGLAVVLLTISLVNFVKYKFDARIAADRLSQLEQARNEKLLSEFVDKP